MLTPRALRHACPWGGADLAYVKNLGMERVYQETRVEDAVSGAEVILDTAGADRKQHSL